MDYVAITALIFSAAALLVGGWAVLQSRETHEVMREQVMTLVRDYVKGSRPTVVTKSKPKGGRVSAQEHLKYFSRVPWPEVSREFYGIATGRPHLLDYFPPDIDLSKQEGHFANALTLVTTEGLSPGVIAAMARRHATVRNSKDEPITGPVYQEVIDILVQVLRRRRVPEESIAALGATIEPLRQAIVWPGMAETTVLPQQQRSEPVPTSRQ